MTEIQLQGYALTNAFVQKIYEKLKKCYSGNSSAFTVWSDIYVILT